MLSREYRPVRCPHEQGGKTRAAVLVERARAAKLMVTQSVALSFGRVVKKRLLDAGCRHNNFNSGQGEA